MVSGSEGMTTLFYGKDLVLRASFGDALKERGHAITWASGHAEVRNHFEHTLYDLVLIEVANDRDASLCASLRDLPHGRMAIILALIREYDQNLVLDILKAGADEFLIESNKNADRIHARLAFAERHAQEKRKLRSLQFELRDSEMRAQAILDTTVDAIITINQRGLIESYNKAAVKLFGYEQYEVIGRNINVLMPDPYQHEHDEYIANYHRTGKRKIIGIGRQVHGRRKDGSTFPMYLAVSEINIGKERVYTGIVRDMSEQLRLESEILRITEYERRRIGQDLHDGLGQMLTGIGLISKNLGQRLSNEGHELGEKIVEVSKMVQEADQYARSLARGLVPVDPDAEGLVAALERMAKNAQKLFGIECQFESTNVGHIDDSTTVTHLYRIAQEAVSNAVKHGKATQIRVLLAGSQEHFRLRIQDNGVGFPAHRDENSGMGVRIMKFRAQLVGAHLEIASEPNEGTIITCTLPRLSEPVKKKTNE